MDRKIVLLGMPSSGKTTLGRQLAEKLSIKFIDLDEAIENKEGSSIPSIFSEKGEEYFRDVESKILQEILKEKENYVLSCGGGTPCFLEGIEKINHEALSVFIDVSPKTLAKRIARKGNTGRPLLDGKQEKELLYSLEDKLEERRNFYERAHISLHNDFLTVELLERSIKLLLLNRK